MDLKEVQVLFIAHRVEVDLEAGDEGVVAAYRFRGVMQLYIDRDRSSQKN